MESKYDSARRVEQREYFHVFSSFCALFSLFCKVNTIAHVPVAFHEGNQVFPDNGWLVTESGVSKHRNRPIGHRVVSCSEDGTIMVWQLAFPLEGRPQFASSDCDLPPPTLTLQLSRHAPTDEYIYSIN